MNNAQQLIAGLKNLSPEDRMKRLVEMQAQAMRDMPNELRQAIEQNPIQIAANTRTGKKTRMIIDIETGRAKEID